MKRLILTLVLVLWASVGWGADWYSNGSASSNGDGTSASPFNTIAAVMTASGTGDTIYITGNFSQEQLTGKTGQTWIKWGTSPVITKTNGSVSVPVANCTYDGLILDGGEQSTQDVIYINAAVTGWKYQNCTIRNGNRLVVLGSTSAGTVKNSILYGAEGDASGYQILVSGGELTFIGNVYSGGRYPLLATTTAMRGDSGSILAYGNAFLGHSGSILSYSRANMTRVDFVNNIVAGYGTKTPSESYAIIATGTPTTIVENLEPNYICDSGKNPTKGANTGVSPTITEGDIQLQGLPGGKFMIAIDDFLVANKTYYSDLSAWATLNRVPVVHFISYASTISAENWTFLNSIGSEYYTFGNHCNASSSLVVAVTPYLFSFSAYPAGATVEFDGTTLKLTSDGTTEVYNQNVTGVTIGTLLTAINAIPSFTAAKHSTIENHTIASVLASTTKVQISTLTDGQMLIDYGAENSRYYDWMITNSQGLMTANLNASYIANTIGYPGGAHDNTLIAWLSANTTYQTGWGGGNRENHCELREGVHPYKLFRIGHEDFIGADTAETTQNIRDVTLMLSTQGNFMGFYAHSAAEFSIENYDLLLATMRNNGVQFVDAQGVYDYMTSFTLDSGLWHRTGSVLGGTGKIGRNSVGVDAGAFITGVNDGGESDMWGKGDYRKPNLGPDKGADIPKKAQVLRIGN